MRVPLFEQYVFEMTGMEASHDYVVSLLGELGKQLETEGVDISEFDLDQLIKGMRVELEHGTKMGDDTNVTSNDPLTTLRIVMAHLKEDPKYYDKLEQVEGEGEVEPEKEPEEKDAIEITKTE